MRELCGVWIVWNWIGETRERTEQQLSFVGGGEYEGCEGFETTGGGTLRQFLRACEMSILKGVMV